MLLVGANRYISFEENILFMIPAADALFKNENNRTSSHANYSYILTQALLGELHTCHSKHKKEKFPIFVQFLEGNFQETKIIIC